jgi:HAD superfamily hydrolase (TIGR01509 family)
MVEEQSATVDTVVFDIGGVIIDWNPRYLYDKLITDPAARDRFLTEVCSPQWNAEQDRGRTFAEATGLLRPEHPDQADLIDAYWTRWPEMLGGLIPGMETLLADLVHAAVPMVAITNWSRETFPRAVAAYPVLQLFQDVVVSGECGLIKPDPEIFRLALNRFGVPAERCLFIDDSPMNVAAARSVGMAATVFDGAEQLRRTLTRLGLLSSSATPA